MKRLFVTLAFTVMMVAAPMGAASAQSQEECTSGYPPSVVPCVEPSTGTVPPSPSAFTGTDVAAPTAAVGVLLVAGFGALYVARRRSRDSESISS